MTSPSEHDQHHGGGSEHDRHEGHSPEMFRDRFWLSLALTVPVVFWAEHIQTLLGYEAPQFTGSVWIPVVLGTVVFFYGGLVWRSSFRTPPTASLTELKRRFPLTN